MSELIKKGDKIRCVNGEDSCGDLMFGMVYEAATNELIRGQFKHTKGVRGNVRVVGGGSAPWMANRFEVLNR